MSSAAKRAAVAGELHKIVKPYGVIDGKNRKIYKSYAVVDGINRLIYMSENFAFTGAYAVSLVEIDGTKYDLYKLTTSGVLSIYADNALFWMCGGGAGGVSATRAYSGAGGGGAFCTSGELLSGRYPVEIGKGGAADTDGTATTLGTYTAAGGKTGAQTTGGSGGTGGGGGDGSSDSARYGTGGTGDGISKYPFGLTSLFAHCAGGGGGTNDYSQDAYIRGGEGGTNGGDGKDGNNPGTHLMYALGGEKGGGHGGYGGQSGGRGSDATFYGSAGGGGGKATTSAYGKGGSGYQGVVYIAIPHKQEPLIIIRQPEDVTAGANGNATFSVTATGEGLTYQWQVLASGAAEWVDVSAVGNKTSTVSITADMTQNGHMYRCIVMDMFGNIKISDAVTLTVVPILITKQPEDVMAAVNETVTFSIAATGEGLTYQWQYRDTSTNGWKNSTIGNPTTTALSVVAETRRDGYRYRCIITDENGNTVTSNAATLTVASA